MASVNTRVVRRSNALQDWAYGRRFRYREVMAAGSGLMGPVVGGAVTAGLGALVAGLAFRPTRALLDRVLPSPGEGPSEKTQRNGFYKIDIHTTHGERPPLSRPGLPAGRSRLRGHGGHVRRERAVPGARRRPAAGRRRRADPRDGDGRACSPSGSEPLE